MELLGVGLGWAALYASCTLVFALSAAVFFSRSVRKSAAVDVGRGTGALSVAALLDVEPLIWITLLAPTATFAITYPISIWFLEPELRMVPALHLLSTSLNHPPASCVGSFGFMLTLPAALLTVLARHLQHASRITELEAAATQQHDGANDSPANAAEAQVGCCCGACRAALPEHNRRCIAAGLVTILGAAGVAAFQWVNSYLFHSFAALLFFAGGLLYCTIDSLIEDATAATTASGGRRRRFLSRFNWAATAAFALFFGVFNATGHARRAPEAIDPITCPDPESPIASCGLLNEFVMVWAAFEIVIFAGILGYFAMLLMGRSEKFHALPLGLVETPSQVLSCQSVPGRFGHG